MYHLNWRVVERTSKAAQLRLCSGGRLTCMSGFSLGRVKYCFGSISELFSSKQSSAQYRDPVPLDGKHKRGQLYTPLAILPEPEGVPWCGPDSSQATLETTLHTS